MLATIRDGTPRLLISVSSASLRLRHNIAIDHVANSYHAGPGTAIRPGRKLAPLDLGSLKLTGGGIVSAHQAVELKLRDQVAILE